MRLLFPVLLLFGMTVQSFAQNGGYIYDAPVPSIGGTMRQGGGGVPAAGGGNEQAYFMQDCQKQFQSQPFLKLMGALLPPEKIRAYCACNYNGFTQRGLMAQYWDYNSLTASGQVQAAYSHPARPSIEAVTQACGPALQ
jgi:hypothetical protein